MSGSTDSASASSAAAIARYRCCASSPRLSHIVLSAVARETPSCDACASSFVRSADDMLTPTTVRLLRDCFAVAMSGVSSDSMWIKSEPVGYSAAPEITPLNALTISKSPSGGPQHEMQPVCINCLTSSTRTVAKIGCTNAGGKQSVQLTSRFARPGFARPGQLLDSGLASLALRVKEGALPPPCSLRSLPPPREMLLALRARSDPPLTVQHACGIGSGADEAVTGPQRSEARASLAARMKKPPRPPDGEPGLSMTPTRSTRWSHAA